MSHKRGSKLFDALRPTTGRPRYWRSQSELADSEESRAAAEHEFPEMAEELADPLSRRSFLKVMSASLALAGMAGCTRQPAEEIVPYIKAPEDLIEGRPNYFATAMPMPAGALPLLVKTDQYRPIKIDGNPEHPYNRGGSDVFAQAALLDLYDPDRSQHVLHRGEQRTWNEFALGFRDAILATGTGRGVRFLTPTITSPTLARQWSQVALALPEAKLVQYDAVTPEWLLAATEHVQYDLDAADVIVSLDADFLSGSAYPGFHKLTRQYAERRKSPEHLNRLYVIEASTSTTGMKAEHRLALRATEIPAFAAELAKAVGVPQIDAPTQKWTAEQRHFLQALARDLKAHAGRCAVLPGLYQHPSLQTQALAMNSVLGNLGKTVLYVDKPFHPLPTRNLAALEELVGELWAGKVEWLVVLDANPAYETPADLHFAEAMRKAKHGVHLGAQVNETARLTEWHVPAAHFLEMWSDARAYDGRVSIVQPLIEPLYAGKTAHQFLQALLDEPGLSPYAAVRETWREELSRTGDFETNWRKALHDGWIEGTEWTAIPAPAYFPLMAVPQPASGIELLLRPDPNLYDGRFANNAWLQELPRPITSLAWENAAQMSLATAERLAVAENDRVELATSAGRVQAPVLIVPGHADDSITLSMGSGRSAAGRVGSEVGCNAFAVVSSASRYLQLCSVRKLAQKSKLAIMKSHYLGTSHTAQTSGKAGRISLEAEEAIGERAIVRATTLAEYRQNPGFAHTGQGRETPDAANSFAEAEKPSENAWAMSIDMASCTGCNACIVSCYAENNIPVVGREQVRKGRNMQWLRIDTYFEGDLEAPRAHFQPMACQHCEAAPCEAVCPVGATVHSPEGLNVMTYNRCVGTRYCSLNCPYKVRRFNFLLYSDFDTESLKLMRNPDVTVRSRGVMEKCTYCVQRIQAARIHAENEQRAIAEGEVQTACQQACPAQAITFGNRNDRNSQVAARAADPRSYSVLEELNLRPRTRYVAAVSHPNPELEAAPADEQRRTQ